MLAILAQIYLNWEYFRRLKKYKNTFYPRILWRKQAPEILLFSILPLILYSVDKHQNINRQQINTAMRKLRRLYPVSSDQKMLAPNSVWDKAANHYSSAYILFAYQKLV